MDGPRGRSDPQPVTALGRLIAEQRRIRGMSYDQVAAAAKAAGYTVSKQRVWQLENEAVPTWPRADVVKGLAVALGVNERVVTSALIESMGLAQAGMPDTDWQLLISKSARLTPAGQRRLKRQIEALLDINDEDGDEK